MIPRERVRLIETYGHNASYDRFDDHESAEFPLRAICYVRLQVGMACGTMGGT
jgi:hypothetical protein